jgi:pimeloyl-ACP methyl ester carboxylesterase
MEPSATLVLLPGVDGTDVFFRPLLAALPASIRTRVLCYPESAPHRYDDLLEVLLRSLEDLPEYYVLGLSYSGPLAVMLAAAQPDKVRGLILAATFVRCPRPDLLPLRPLLSAPVIWLLRAARRLPIWLFSQADDPFRRAKAETWGRVSARSLSRRLRMVLRVDVRALLRSCWQPVLCLAFGEDDVVPMANAEEMIRLHPAARLVTVPGKHLGIWTHPQAVAHEVARFVDEQQRPQRRNPAGHADRAPDAKSPGKMAEREGFEPPWGD